MEPRYTASSMPVGQPGYVLGPFKDFLVAAASKWEAYRRENMQMDRLGGWVEGGEAVESWYYTADGSISEPGAGITYLCCYNIGI